MGYKDWKGYYLKRHQIKGHVVTMPHFKVMAPLTAGETAAYERHEIDTTCNEWLLFHGTNSDSAEKIAKGDFTMRLAGSNTGMLYEEDRRWRLRFRYLLRLPIFVPS